MRQLVLKLANQLKKYNSFSKSCEIEVNMKIFELFATVNSNDVAGVERHGDTMQTLASDCVLYRVSVITYLFKSGTRQ